MTSAYDTRSAGFSLLAPDPSLKTTDMFYVGMGATYDGVLSDEDRLIPTMFQDHTFGRHTMVYLSDLIPGPTNETISVLDDVSGFVANNTTHNKKMKTGDESILSSPYDYTDEELADRGIAVDPSLFEGYL